MLLAYSLNLCVKRLSAVQHKTELESTLRDLTRYLCLLQRFFPMLFKQIRPNLQQGLTMALHIVTAEMEPEAEGNNVLNRTTRLWHMRFPEIPARPAL
jgi:hypothetical protein